MFITEIGHRVMSHHSCGLGLRAMYCLGRQDDKATMLLCVSFLQATALTLA